MTTSDMNRPTRIPGGNTWFLLLFCFLGYATLNRGFAYIGYYPFFVGEFALVYYLFVMNHRYTLPSYLGTPAGKIWIVFFFYSLLIFVISVSNDLNESIRNSVFWVYTIFFYIGYSYGNRLIRNREIDRFNDVLLFCAKASVIYYALYPFREKLCSVTMFFHGGTTALVGYYSTLHALSVGIMFFLIFHKRTHFSLIWLATGLILIVALSQARASILSLAAIMFYLVVLRRRLTEIKGLIQLAAIVAIVCAILSISGMSIEGERGFVTADFFQDAIKSIFLTTDVDSLEGSRTARLLWWSLIIGQTISTRSSLLFGMGLDKVLIDSAPGVDTILRYPHNSFVSVLGFSGFVGLSLYCMLLLVVFWKVLRSARYGNSLPLVKWYPVFAIGYFVAAFFGTVFEAPFHNFVFWVISGIIYCVATHTGLSTSRHTEPDLEHS